MQQVKILLDESDIPENWYNVVADMPNPPAPPLGPDGKPIGPEALAAIFPGAIIEQARATLDFGAPVAVVLIDILNFIGDGAVVTQILRTLRAAMVPGSYLAVMQPASDLDPSLEAAQRQWNQVAPTPVVLRPRAEVAGWTEGLDLVEPGVVPVTWWRPEDSGPPAAMPLYGFVARKR